MAKLYSMAAVDDALEFLTENGYEIVTIPGSLLDSYICIAPDDSHYNVILRENYVNAWSSAYTVRNYKKLPKWALAEVERVGSEVSEN